jgi:MFS family permease
MSRLEQSMTRSADGEVAGHSGRLFNMGFIRVFLINMLGQYAIYTMNTLTGPFADSLGATPAVVGLVSSLFAVTAILFKGVSAPTIDALRRKWVLIIALCLVLIACLFYATSRSVTDLVVARLLTGVALAFLPTICFVMASDTLPAGKLAMGLGIYALSNVIIQALAPVIGLYLAGRVGYNTTFAIVAGIIATTLASVFLMRLDTSRVCRPFSFRPDSMFSAAVLVPSFLLLVEALVWSQVNTFLVLFGAERGVPNDRLGLFFSVLAVTLVGSRPLLGHMADKFGASRVMMASIVFLAFAFLTISAADSLPLFLLAGVISAFGYAGCQPTLMAVCFRLVPAQRKGAASCTAYMGQDVGNLIGGAVGGYLVLTFGYANMWRLMLLPLAAAALVSFIYRRRLDSEPFATLQAPDPTTA